jgi:hypothetical protein
MGNPHIAAVLLVTTTRRGMKSRISTRPEDLQARDCVKTCGGLPSDVLQPADYRGTDSA